MRQPYRDEQVDFSFAQERVDLGMAALLHGNGIAEAFENALDYICSHFINRQVHMPEGDEARLRKDGRGGQ